MVGGFLADLQASGGQEDDDADGGRGLGISEANERLMMLEVMPRELNVLFQVWVGNDNLRAMITGPA